ncbi:MAG: ABC transporter ATP-binding protein [Muribaculaceae bacterium]|nr:ABC transporter ATP-binding protein [Muribaculaceae bacterium]
MESEEDKRVVVSTLSLTTGYRAGREEREVTRDLTASLYAGELTSFLGPNGAGKSTLLRTLSGFLPPLSGEVRVEGRPLHDLRGRELARTVGVVLTERTDVENMDVETLVGLGRAPYTGFWGRLTADDREAVERAIALVGIEDLRHREANSLSDGERQKVMIAKALAQSTPVIFLDEPTAFLDFPSKVEIMRLLASIAHSEEKTIFMSTHDLDIALQLSDRLWLIDKKHGVTIGSHHELTESGALEKYFLRPGICFDRNTGRFRIEI